MRKATALPVITEPNTRSCGRCGSCCEFVMLPHSPRHYRNRWVAAVWAHQFYPKPCPQKYANIGLDYERMAAEIDSAKIPKPRPLKHPDRNISDEYLQIYAMLGDRCRGFMPPANAKISGVYVYGPCANYARVVGTDGKEIGACSIHSERPGLCSGYPYYGGGHILLTEPNPGYMRGCGYNLSPYVGQNPATILKRLRPLNEDEL